ncbi:hypothetical protein ACJRO7_020285 [Eucalyptus globulus]|uniref:Uncharacterized protein n=1 Tax=Eucalyptus globulus TaxID=34317 RepID=A0ABD3KGZ7_EUCGL
MATATAESEIATATAESEIATATTESEIATATAESKIATATAEAKIATQEFLEKSMDRLTEDNKSLQELISNRISRTQEFMNLYFVFQGIVFSSVLTSSETIRCKLKWTFYALSLLASIYNFLAVLVNIRMSGNYYESMADNWDLLDKRRGQLDNLRMQRRNNADQQRPNPYRFRIHQRNAICAVTLLLLLIFSVAMVYGFTQIHCCHRCSYG